MSRLVNLSDSIYEELTRMKRAKNQSYSEVVEGLLAKKEHLGRTITWDEMIANQLERDKHYKGKKEKIDYDKAAYGVSLDRD